MSTTSRTTTRPRRTRRQRLRAIAVGLGPFARPHRRQLALAAVASLMVTAAQLALPWPLKGMVELSLPEGQRSRWLSELLPSGGSPVTWLAGAFVVLGVAMGVAEYRQRLAVSRFVVLTINDARMGIFTRLVRSSPRKRASLDPADVLTRVVGDTARLRVGLKGVLIHLLQHGLFLAGVWAVLMVLDVRLGLVYLAGLLVALGIAGWGTARTAAMARKRRGRESRRAGEVLRTAAEPGGALAGKDPGRERSVAILTQVKGLTACAVQGVLALTACAVLIVSLRLAEAGQLSTGDVALVASYLLMLHYPVMRMGRQITRLGPQLTSAERLARLAEPGGHRVASS